MSERSGAAGKGEGPDRAALALPAAPPGLAVGLFGGSFDPPHEGHRLVAEAALRRLALDQLWWMVTPGNPLKDHGRLAPIGRRVAWSRALVAEDRRIRVTAFEAAHRIRFSADTLALVRRRRPGARFVWVMGADSLAGFHLWQDWRRIARLAPIAVVDRPGATLRALRSPAARWFAGRRVPERLASRLALLRPPALVFLTGPRSALSSTLLRAQAGGGGRASGGGNGGPS